MSADHLEFVDTNILVYAHDRSAGAKWDAAKSLVSRLWEHRTGCLSVQVLQELFVTLTAKIPNRLTPGQTRPIIANLASWNVYSPDADDVLAAIDISTRYKISFWDAMIVRSASTTGCSILWSEDLIPSQEYEGVVVRNPFL